MEERICRKAIS